MTEIVGAALRAAAGDVDGDGRSELILADAEHLRVVTHAGSELASTPVRGGIEVLSAADLDGDGRAEILAGWGQTVQHREGTAHVSVYRLARGRLLEDAVPIPASTRQDVAAVLPAGTRSAPAVIVAFFESKYMVKTSMAERGPSGWTLRDLGVIRMATSYARGDVDGDEHPDLVVGRVYDDRDKDGDAFVLAPDGRRTSIPTTRGVRGLAVADTDGDGRGKIFLGDGWHQNYGAHARGLPTWTRWQDGAFRSEVIEDTPGQYTIWRILPADIDGDGRPEIVTQREPLRARVPMDGLALAGAHDCWGMPRHCRGGSRRKPWRRNPHRGGPFGSREPEKCDLAGMKRSPPPWWLAWLASEHGRRYFRGAPSFKADAGGNVKTRLIAAFVVGAIELMTPVTVREPRAVALAAAASAASDRGGPRGSFGRGQGHRPTWIAALHLPRPNASRSASRGQR